jgi:hypothetical protein
MRLLVAARTSVHQPPSIARIAQMTGAAAPGLLLSTRKLLNDGFVTTTTVDGIMHHELSDPTPTATTAVRK